MGRRGIAAVAGTLALLAAVPAASSGAAQVWDGPRLCRPTTMEMTGTALLCARADELDGVQLVITGVDGVRTWDSNVHDDVAIDVYEGPDPIPDTRVAKVGGGEPLLPGERLTASWTALRGRAVLVVQVGDPVRRSRQITVPLRSQDGGASVSVAADGVVTVRAGERTAVHRVPPLGPGDPGGPAVPWTARTPRAAVADVLPHLRSYDALASATMCAAIESAVRRSYAAWTDVLDGPRAAAYVCASQMAWAAQELLATRGTIGAVKRISATQATVDVRLRQAFDAYEGPYRRTAHSRVLVVRERDGRWRIATPDALYVDARVAPSLARLRTMRASMRREAAARHAFGVRSHRAIARAVARVGTGDVACGGPLRRVDAPADDAWVWETVTRDPRSHRGDLVAVEQGTVDGRLCFTLTFAAVQPDPLAIQLDVRPGAHFDLRMGRGRAILSGSDRESTAVAGIRVDRRGPRMRIVLPAEAGPAPAALRDWMVSIRAQHPYGYQFEDSAGTVAPRVEDPLSAIPQAPTR